MPPCGITTNPMSFPYVKLISIAKASPALMTALQSSQIFIGGFLMEQSSYLDAISEIIPGFLYIGGGNAHNNSLFFMERV